MSAKRSIAGLLLLSAALGGASWAGCGGSGTSALRDTEEPVQFEEERTAAPSASPEVERAEGLLARGDAAGARAILEAALEANPRDARALLDMGLSYELEEQFDEAAAQYRAAIEASPGFAEALNNLGVLQRESGDLEGAVTSLRAALEARPGFASARLNLALALEEAGDDEGAERQYRVVSRLAPREPYSRIHLGHLLLRRGNQEAALVAFRGAEQPAQGDRAALDALGSGFRRAGDPAAAVRVLRAAIAAEEEPAPPPVHAELALALYAADHHPEAEQTLSELLSAHADYAIAHYLLANMLAQRGAGADAATHYEAYLRLSPNGAQAAQARQRLERVRGN
jgi:Tfp pilus assembly protein PilF